jgi:hypothetical protein
MQAKRIVQMRDGKVVVDELTARKRVHASSPAVPVAVGAGVPALEPAVTYSPTESAVEEEEDDADVEVQSLADVPARFASGANGALVCGLLAPAFLLLSVVAGVLLGRMGIDPTKITAENPPPPAFSVLALLTAFGVLAATVTGFIGIFLGRAVLRRIRTVPGVWIGAKRARAGWICGLVTVLVPVALFAVRIVACMVQMPRSPG